MSRFREELTIIPEGAWALAVLLYLGMFAWLLRFSTPPSGTFSLPSAGQVAFAACIPLVIAIYALLAGYVYGDAKRRGMRHVLWTLLALLAPSGVGFILYFLLRERLTQCIACGRSVRPGFGFCPHCGAALSRFCSQCRRAVEPGWSHCPQCGASLNAPPAEPVAPEL